MFPKIFRTPKSSILVGFFHYKPPTLGYPYFWKHSYSHLYLPGLEGVLNTTPTPILKGRSNDHHDDSKRLARRLPQMPPAKHLTRCWVFCPADFLVVFWGVRFDGFPHLLTRWWQLKYFFFSALFGEDDSHFDTFFSTGWFNHQPD